MSMPLISQFFLQTYGWRGSFLLLGGLNLQLVVCGVLLRPQQTCEETMNESNNDKAATIYQTGSKDSSKLACLSNLLSLHLFFNFNYLCLLCIFTASGYYYIGWLIYFVPHGEDVGFSPYEASFLATGGGIGNLIGALIFPLAGKFLSGKNILYLSTLITCLSLGLDPIMAELQSYVGLMISSFGVNFGFAVTDCAIFKETVAEVKEDDVSNAINWLFVGYSIGSVTTGFLSGKNMTLTFLIITRLWSDVHRRCSSKDVLQNWRYVWCRSFIHLIVKQLFIICSLVLKAVLFLTYLIRSYKSIM